jgi:hypothetical protein
VREIGTYLSKSESTQEPNEPEKAGGDLARYGSKKRRKIARHERPESGKLLEPDEEKGAVVSTMEYVFVYNSCK